MNIITNMMTMLQLLQPQPTYDSTVWSHMMMCLRFETFIGIINMSVTASATALKIDTVALKRSFLIDRFGALD